MTGNMARERYKPKAADYSLYVNEHLYLHLGYLSKSVSYYLIAILVFQIYVFEFNIFTGAGTRSIGSAT